VSKGWRFVVAAVSAAAVTAGYIALAGVSFNLLHREKGDMTRSSLPPVAIIGKEQTVFDWSKDRCSANHYPDLPARAFRDSDGQVHLILSHFITRRMSGATLGRLRRSCAIVMAPDKNPDPAQFDDYEWIAAPYSPDGRTVHALVHNEYQGHRHTGRCPSGEYLKCWYNAITFARSTDGGRTFQQPTSPEHLVASIPYRYIAEKGPYGLFAPSNIVWNPRDSHFYALVTANDYRAQKWGSCLIRTANLSNPRQWRAWNGSAFRVRFINPYRTKSDDSSDHVCNPISSNEIQRMSSSITWSAHFNKWLLIGAAFDRSRTGTTEWGIYYSLSDDLIHWDRRKLIRKAEFVYSYKCGDPDPIMYPSLLDHESSSRNFETVDEDGWLFYTRFHYRNCQMTSNRDLVRVPVSFR
jgi:hypothetical protein